MADPRILRWRLLMSVDAAYRAIHGLLRGILPQKSVGHHRGLLGRTLKFAHLEGLALLLCPLIEAPHHVCLLDH